MNKYPHLFTPIKIKNIRFKNRILGAPQNAPDTLGFRLSV